MKSISQMPAELKALAELRRAENAWSVDEDCLADAFGWGSTPEGDYFWQQVWEDSPLLKASEHYPKTEETYEIY